MIKRYADDITNTFHQRMQTRSLLPSGFWTDLSHPTLMVPTYPSVALQTLINFSDKLSEIIQSIAISSPHKK